MNFKSKGNLALLKGRIATLKGYDVWLPMLKSDSPFFARAPLAPKPWEFLCLNKGDYDGLFEEWDLFPRKNLRFKSLFDSMGCPLAPGEERVIKHGTESGGGLDYTLPH